MDGARALRPDPARPPGETVPPSFGELANSGSFLLHIAQLATRETVLAFDPDLPLSLAEATVLTLIAANPRARQGEIADALHIKWPHMTKLVRDLETRGLVERWVPPADRRSVFLRLTRTGTALHTALKPRMAAVDDVAMTPLDPAERAELVRLLLKVARSEVPGTDRPGTDGPETDTPETEDRT